MLGLQLMAVAKRSFGPCSYFGFWQLCSSLQQGRKCGSRKNTISLSANKDISLGNTVQFRLTGAELRSASRANLQTKLSDYTNTDQEKYMGRCARCKRLSETTNNPWRKKCDVCAMSKLWLLLSEGAVGQRFCTHDPWQPNQKETIFDSHKYHVEMCCKTKYSRFKSLHFTECKQQCDSLQSSYLYPHLFYYLDRWWPTCCFICKCHILPIHNLKPR